MAQPKATLLPLVLIVFSVIVFVVDLFSSGIFGRFINLFIPCVVTSGNSAPCYLIYDLELFYAMIGIFLLSLLSLIIISIINVRNKKKMLCK